MSALYRENVPLSEFYDQNTLVSGGSFLLGEAVGAWSWPLTSFYCRSQECLALYLHLNTFS